ncbi:hypothetical protein NM688_g6772 [Phlebia brevispora]|uniref:Uncharacterized protein n=1 Tax=Phlebia brevispora TaxID=194682 RepID=A0ACC1SCN4_9APHY|nr:hypothetical protein NM688_g6772 [Phlebia brevispora]
MSSHLLPPVERRFVEVDDQVAVEDVWHDGLDVVAGEVTDNELSEEQSDGVLCDRTPRDPSTWGAEA